MKGKGFLKVCGILMIIGGGISCLISLIAIIGVAAAFVAGAGLLAFALIVGIIGAVLELVTGIIGVKNCAKPEAATKCLAWGVVVLVLNVLSVILSAVNSGDFGFFSFITSCIVPVLFIIGAVLNKNSADTQSGANV